jgi:ribA/ribD-fused uncharacterized protein
VNIRNVDELNGWLAAGNTAKYIYFWGHSQRSSGIDESCLSQWFPSEFRVRGHRFPTAEHFMMFQKADLFGDSTSAEAILAADSPGAAKALGRKVRGFDNQTWVEHRWNIVVEGSLEKFSQNASLRHYLLNTGQRVLVEASPVDRIWGIGLDKASAQNLSPAEWRGLNLLGFALMEARDRLREDPS